MHTVRRSFCAEDGIVLLEIVVGLVILVGLIGIVIPVLPGSILIGLSILVWAIVTGTGPAWAVFAACAVLLVAGAVVTWFVQAKHTRAAGVPGRSLVVAGLAGIVGFFVVPVVGLLLFFPLGLFLAEYARLREPRRAWASALVGLKATGLGLIAELGLALAAAGVWLVAVLAGI
ncbi:MAG: DUF456 domain-containing protein [Actinobacteria bacterium]|nr:DUF456 domain-containing protein [Actinomycetota bacterium]